MSTYPPHLIDEIRSRIRLTALVGRDAKLERNGRLHKACCPFHTEKTPSLTLYPDQHFHCFGCQAHGDAFGYVMQRDSVGFREAVALLAREAGVPLPAGDADADAAERRRRWAAEERRKREEAERRRRERELARRHAWAAGTAAEGNTDGQLVALYLGNDRSIPTNAPYPDSIRFHPGRNALMAVATDCNGKITGGQFIHLDTQGHKLTKDAAVARGYKAPKQTFGIVSGSVVHLPCRHNPWRYGMLPVRFIAESVEAACSIWQVTLGQEANAVLGVGNLRGAFRKDYCNVVCLDDDPRGSAAWRQANKAIRASRADGHVVIIVNTWEIRRGDKSDLNDILRQAGSSEGSKLLQQRLSGTLFPEAKRAKRLKPDDAVRQIKNAAAKFMAEAGHRAWSTLDDEKPVPQVAIKADTAIGKSSLMREALALAISAIRKARDEAAKIGREVKDAAPAVIFIPRIDLADEAAEKMRAVAPELKLDVRVWRGRSQPGMCRDIESIREARARMLDPQKHVCERCPFAANCAYQEQRKQRADIWFAAHPLLYTNPPKPLRDPWMVWIDETPIDAALVGVGEDVEALALPLDALRRIDPIAEKPDASMRLHELRSLAVAALETQPPGALVAAPFRGAGLTVAICQEGEKLEWSTKIVPSEGEPFEAADRNLDLARRARFWKSLGALLDDKHERASGWMRIATRDGHTVIQLRGRRDVKDAWHVPTILTDASLQIRLALHLWPSLPPPVDCAVEAKHQHIRQVVDRSFGLTSLDATDAAIADPGPGAHEKIRLVRKTERARRRRALRDVHAKLHQQARLAAPGKLLAVAQKRIVEQIESIGPLPPNLAFMHHGAVSGIDCYRDVSRIVIVGRQAPAAAAVEACAEALTGAACTRLPSGQWYQRIDAVHELADGRLVSTERDYHPDAIAEQFRRRITTLELQQIIGRGRGIWRSADNPLHILVLTDVPLELPIEELTPADAERPSFEDRQVAAGTVAFQCAAHAAKLYPEIWRDADRAQYARRQHGGGQPAGTVAWRYQVAGQGERVWHVYAPPAMTADAVRSYLASRLGPLAKFEAAIQPKGAFNPQSEDTSTENSRHFGGEVVPDRSIPFVWQAWKAWRVDHPPDG